MTEQSERQQPLKVLARAGVLAKLRALHNKGVTAYTTTNNRQEPITAEIGDVMKDATIYCR